MCSPRNPTTYGLRATADAAWNAPMIAFRLFIDNAGSSLVTVDERLHLLRAVVHPPSGDPVELRVPDWYQGRHVLSRMAFASYWAGIPPGGRLPLGKATVSVVREQVTRLSGCVELTLGVLTTRGELTLVAMAELPPRG